MDAIDTTTGRPPSRHALGQLPAWWWEGVRSTVGLVPRVERLDATPALLFLVLALSTSVYVALQRLYIDGAAEFNPHGPIEFGLSWIIALGLCWIVHRAAVASGTESRPVAALFVLLVVQGATIAIPTELTVRYWVVNGSTAHWLVFLAQVAWFIAAQSRLLTRTAGPLTRAIVVAVILLQVAVSAVVTPMSAWFPVGDDPSSAPARVSLTQERFELQPVLLASALDAVQPGRAGVVELYAITFAPYASQAVFEREGDLVADVLGTRFDAQGRTVRLVNQNRSANDRPWATPLNLERTIRRMAERMNREEDILMIYLTSHGGRDGRLATDFWPIDVDAVTAEQLRRWLDEAGIRYRVIAVSACFSGTWLEPLRGDATLVMTAADAEHTSYGCGSRSELTFFGRAMFDEALRETRSFEQAHAQAREVIRRREVEAGKSDGYSNPQMALGESIRPQLEHLERRLFTRTP